jgi:hypothetical protein
MFENNDYRMNLLNFRKVLDDIGREDDRERRSYLRNYKILNALFLDVDELDMACMSKMVHELPKMDAKAEVVMAKFSKKVTAVWKDADIPDLKFATFVKITEIIADAILTLFLS